MLLQLQGIRTIKEADGGELRQSFFQQFDNIHSVTTTDCNFRFCDSNNNFVTAIPLQEFSYEDESWCGESALQTIYVGEAYLLNDNGKTLRKLFYSN